MLKALCIVFSVSMIMGRRKYLEILDQTLKLFPYLYIHMRRLVARKINCLYYCLSVKKLCCFQEKILFFLELNNIEQSLAGVNLCSKHILQNDPNFQCCITYTYTASCCNDKKGNWLITTLLIINLSQVIKTGFSVSHSVLCTTANAYSPCFKFPICVLVYEQFTFHCLMWLHVYKIKASLEETNGYSK